MYYFSTAEFARTKGAKDKGKRKSRGSGLNTAAKVGAAIAGTGALLYGGMKLKRKFGKKSFATQVDPWKSADPKNVGKKRVWKQSDEWHTQKALPPAGALEAQKLADKKKRRSKFIKKTQEKIQKLRDQDPSGKGRLTLSQIESMKESNTKEAWRRRRKKKGFESRYAGQYFAADFGRGRDKKKRKSRKKLNPDSPLAHAIDRAKSGATVGAATGAVGGGLTAGLPGAALGGAGGAVGGGAVEGLREYLYRRARQKRKQRR